MVADHLSRKGLWSTLSDSTLGWFREIKLHRLVVLPLQKLHDDDNQPIFNSIIIVTDRTVLDRQLQETITSFDATTGLVETIGDNKSSKDLLKAINDGKQIIITTLQKFPVIYQDVESTAGKRFAVIVDEAHFITDRFRLRKS